MVNSKDLNLVWIDLEMTGLEEDHVIIEIATVVTDSNLVKLSEGPAIAIHRTEKELTNINEWSLEQHAKSGLLRRVKESKISLAEAESLTLEFLTPWVNQGQSPLCGNSIATDRRFLEKEMPKLNSFLHYRMIDVSTVKELVKRWYPYLEVPNKKSSHLALDDIKESIAELKWYKENVFTQETTDA